MAYLNVNPKTTRAEAARLFSYFIRYCQKHIDTRIIYELNNHHKEEVVSFPDGTSRIWSFDGYLMIDFSPDCGESGFDDGTLAVVSSDYNVSPGFCSYVRNPANLFNFMYSLFLHRKVSKVYMEGY